MNTIKGINMKKTRGNTLKTTKKKHKQSLKGIKIIKEILDLPYSKIREVMWA